MFIDKGLYDVLGILCCCGGCLAQSFFVYFESVFVCADIEMYLVFALELSVPACYDICLDEFEGMAYVWLSVDVGECCGDIHGQ